MCHKTNCRRKEGEGGKKQKQKKTAKSTEVNIFVYHLNNTIIFFVVISYDYTFWSCSLKELNISVLGKSIVWRWLTHHLIMDTSWPCLFRCLFR